MANDHDEKLPNVGPTHIICKKAIMALRNALPTSWIITKPDEDYGLDFFIETVTNNNADGLEYFVQLKGKNEFIAGTDGKLRVTVNASTINYWLKHLSPVMIVCVDIESGKIDYSWLEYAYDNYPYPVVGQESKTLTIEYHDLTKSESHAEIIQYLTAKQTSNIRRQKTITDLSSISNISRQKIEELHSRAPELSALGEISNLIDPRFDINFSVNGKNINVSVRPKTSEPITIATLKKNASVETISKIREIYDSGGTVSLKSDEFDLSGIDRIRNALSPNSDFSEITLSTSIPSNNISVLLETSDNREDWQIVAIMTLSVDKRGKKETTLVLSAANFPIKLYLIADSAHLRFQGKYYTEECDFESFSLNMILKGLELIRNIRHGMLIRIRAANEDETLYQLKTNRVPEDPEINEEISIVEALIKVNKAFRITIPYKRYRDENSLRNLSLALRVLDNRCEEVLIDDEIKAEVKREAIREILMLYNKNKSLDVKIEHERYPVTIFEQEIDLGRCVQIFPSLKPVRSTTDLTNIADSMSADETYEMMLIPIDNKNRVVKTIFRD